MCHELTICVFNPPAPAACCIALYELLLHTGWSEWLCATCTIFSHPDLSSHHLPASSPLPTTSSTSPVVTRIAVISATLIYLTALVIINAVFIFSMLIVLPSNIWCTLVLMEGDIRAWRRPNIWVTDPIFDLIKTWHDQGLKPAPRIKTTWSGILPPRLWDLYIPWSQSQYSTLFRCLPCHTWSSCTQCYKGLPSQICLGAITFHTYFICNSWRNGTYCCVYI